MSHPTPPCTIMCMTASETRFGLSIKEAAPKIGISQRTLRHLVEQGEIRIVRIGRRILLRPSDIEAFLEQHSTGG